MISLFLFNCSNPLGPSLAELETGKDYFPLKEYTEWYYETDSGDSLTLKVVSEYTNSDGKVIYDVKELIGGNTSSYSFSHSDKGIFFYRLGEYKPFFKYPLIQHFSWSFTEGLQIWYFEVTEEEKDFNDHENLKVVVWEHYSSTYNEDFLYSDTFYLKDGLGPVYIYKGETDREFILKSTK